MASLVFSLNGNAPFTVTYSDGIQDFVLLNILGGHSIDVFPTATTVYTLVSMTGGSLAGCSSMPGSTVTIAVNETYEQAEQAEICEGESILLGGAMQTASGVYTDDFSSITGCDSTVVTTLIVNELKTVPVTETDCDPNQAGVFENVFTDQNGCDSTVITTVVFAEGDTSYFTEPTCDINMTGVFSESFTGQSGCDSTIVTTVFLVPADSTYFTEPTCDENMVGVVEEIFTAQNGCDSMVFTTFILEEPDTFFQTNTTCDPNMSGVFSETFSAQNGCDSVVITTVSLLDPNDCEVEFSLATDIIPCDENEGSFTIEILVGQLPIDYSYTNTTGTTGTGVVTTNPFLVSQLPAGNYSVILTHANGTTTIEDIVIEQATPPVVTIDLTNDLACFGEQTAAATATAVGDFPPYNFLWSNGATTPDISNLGAGIYEVTVSGALNCEAIAQVDVLEPPILEMMFTISSPDCFTANSGSLLVEALGGTPPYQYAINGGDFQNEDFFSNLSAGAYQVLVQDANGCELSESFAINAPIPADVELGDDMTIELGDGATIQAIVNLPDSLLENLDWSGLDENVECPTCPTQNVIPLLTSTYSITIESSDGCKDTDALTLFVDRDRHVFVPTAFSPNGDGNNDVFYVFAKDNSVEKIHSFLIFDRWGESMFEARNFQPNDPSHGWDGKHRGETMNPAVFVWFAEIEFIDGQVELFEGDVVLVR